MSDLLEKVLHAHGGIENWRRVDHIDFLLTLRGAALELKKQPHGLRAAMVKVDTKRQRTAIAPFPAPGSRGIYEEGTVRVETYSGIEISKLDEPRKTFEGYDRQSPWNELQFLYFIGYALTNYLTMPFLLASDGVRSEEVAPHEEHGERWRVLKVTFPDNIEVHCKEQRFYFNDAGHLVRNDYTPDVSKGPASHYTFDHRSVDGFIFPTYRRVVFRDANDQTLLRAPSIFRLDLEAITLS